MILHVNIRGADARGDFTIQQRVTASHPLDALSEVMDRWGIEAESLRRVHVSEPDPKSRAGDG